MTFSDEELAEMLTRLDEKCWSCQYSGPMSVADADDPTKCGICYGRGWLTTRAGDALLDFLGRHFGGETRK